MDEMQLIKVTRDTTSDEMALLAQWHVKNGENVRKGQVIVSVETSKAIYDIETERDGYLFYKYEEGMEVPIGETIAVVTDDINFKFDELNIKEDETKESEIKFSKKALKLIEENKLDRNMFAKKGLITERDILNYIQQGEKKELHAQNEDLRILILGGGGHAKMCIDIIRQMKTYKIFGIIDESLDIGSEVLGVPVIGRDKDLNRLFIDGIRLIVNGVGAAQHHPEREKIYEKIKSIGFQLPNIIHPKAIIEPSAELGEGNQIMANAVVGSAAQIGNNCIINSGAVVSHDCILQDNVHIAPGAILAGSVNVGKNTLIGMGSTIYIGLNIGQNVTIYNGCNITRHVADSVIVKRDFLAR